MPRRGNIPKRDVLPDPVYNSKVVTKVINQVMLDGKKGIAQKIVYDAFDIIKAGTTQPEIFHLVGLFEENVGPEGLKYFSFIFTVFLFVLFGNLIGLFPYAFTYTSHLAAVGGLSIIALLFNMCVGIKKKKIKFLRTFLPKGIPLALAPLIVPIETISYLSKPFSLTVRLVANMTVGHIMLKIIAGFIAALGILGVIPFLFDACIIVFEIFIAMLQAFIYTVLSCIYLGDAIHEH